MNKTPRTFCVTLKETPIRTRMFMEMADQIGLKVEPFYGILGNRLGLVSKLSNKLETENDTVKITEGGIGCNLSHMCLWKALQQLPEDEFLVFEDDAVVQPTFVEDFLNRCSKLPDDWQMVYVGFVPYGFDIGPIPVEEGICIRLPSATHAYMVKKNVLQELIDGMYPFQSNIDLALLKRVLPKLRYYVFDPGLAHQRSYLNSQDKTWISLVYDWKNDIYGVKKKLLDGLDLSEGWHPLERNETDMWRWSHGEFKINLPKNLDGIVLCCTSPIDNEVIITSGPDEANVPVKHGENVILLAPRGHTEIHGKMKVPFIPSEMEPGSKDTRPLGICLKRIILKVGEADVEIPVSDLTKGPLPSASFKLM